MHIFISDAHIRTDNSYRAKMLLAFLREFESKISSLFILGDMFEFWFEYNIVFPKHYFKTLASLYNLIQNKKPVHYILGNHEVTIGNFFKNFGFIIHKNSARLDIDGKKVFLCHGHRLDRRIWTVLWEHILNSRINHKLYTLLHPDIGVFLAQGIAYLSRKQRRSPNAARLLENYARTQLQNCDIVFLGHSHIPVFKKFPHNKYYVNTGDWIDHFSYGVIDKGKVSLEYYKHRV